MEPQNNKPIEPVKPTAPMVEVSPVPVVSAPQATTSIPSLPKKLNLPKIDPKQIVEFLKNLPRKYKIMAGFVGLLLFLLVLVSLTGQGRKVTGLILPSPSPIPASSPVGEVLIPTQYATDPEILDIEKTMTTFDVNLSATDLKEDSLRVPNLDYDVNFKEK